MAIKNMRVLAMVMAGGKGDPAVSADTGEGQARCAVRREVQDRGFCP